MQDLSERLANRVQLTSDIVAVENAFRADIDYAMRVKFYGTDPAGERRYSPAKCIGARKREVTGDHHADAHAEVYSAHSNAFSKKIESHACSVLQLRPHS